jgi:molybdate transport system substrate-binding protein
MKRLLAIALVFTVLAVLGCGESKKSETKKQLLMYIGITMVKPVRELANRFEKANNCEIKIIQGGSQDLYDSLKLSQQGDVYLPGSLSYRKKNLKDGFLLDGVFVGYNKAAIVVKKGNPLGITNDLKNFTDKKYNSVLCNPESGSIGNETKRVLNKFGTYKEAIAHASYLTTDSRNLTKAIREGGADICINWYATTFWDDNKNYVEAIPIDEKYAKKKKLVFNLLKSANHPGLAKKFMDYAASKEGRKVFYDYGFLDDGDLERFDNTTF